MSIVKIPKIKEGSMFGDAKKKPSVDFDSKRVKDFIEGAPDGIRRRWKLKGKKVVITLTIYPEDLQKVDEIAETLGITRTALINLWIQQNLNKSEFDCSDLSL